VGDLEVLLRLRRVGSYRQWVVLVRAEGGMLDAEVLESMVDGVVDVFVDHGSSGT
jgi:hypothetical protein